MQVAARISNVVISNPLKQVKHRNRTVGIPILTLQTNYSQLLNDSNGQHTERLANTGYVPLKLETYHEDNPFKDVEKCILKTILMAYCIMCLHLSVFVPALNSEEVEKAPQNSREAPLKWFGEGGDSYTVGLIRGKIQPCVGKLPCVSTSSFQSPSRFLPPWTFLESPPVAQEKLEATLLRMGAKLEDSKSSGYVYATLTRDLDSVDDLEFLFSRGNIVTFRSISRKYSPDPPFCWWKGCINGPHNRKQMEDLRDDLGWVSLETDEEKQWVPLLLH